MSFQIRCAAFLRPQLLNGLAQGNVKHDALVAKKRGVSGSGRKMPQMDGHQRSVWRWMRLLWGPADETAGRSGGVNFRQEGF
jgi:hypothetical protein